MVSRTAPARSANCGAARIGDGVAGEPGRHAVRLLVGEIAEHLEIVRTVHRHAEIAGDHRHAREPAERFVFDDLLGLGVLLHEPHLMVHGKLGASSFAGCNHPVAFGDRYRHRLLAQDRLRAFRGAETHEIGMRGCGGRHHEHFGLRLLEHLALIRKGGAGRQLKVRDCLGAGAFLDVEHANDVQVQAAHDFQMPQAHAAKSNECCLHLL